jgi:cytochrome c peroxidase
MAFGVLLLPACQDESSDNPATPDTGGDQDTTLTYDPTPYPFDMNKLAKSFDAELLSSFDNTPDDNPTTVEGVELGRHLFYDVRLSRNRTVSCASCHQQDQAFSDDRRLSTGLDGGKTMRHSMPLFNLQWQGAFNWDGSSATLEKQMVEPIHNPVEMDMDTGAVANRLDSIDRYPPMFYKAFGSYKITGERIQHALAQFCRSLVSYNSRYDRHLRAEGGQQYVDYVASMTNGPVPSDDELARDYDRYRAFYQQAPNQDALLSPAAFQGLQLFTYHPSPEDPVRGADCMHCHPAATGTFNNNFPGREEYRNNGLQAQFPEDKGREEVTGDIEDRGEFKAPSLRNVALTAPYMHDGRFATLEEVVEHYDQHVARSPYQDDHMANTGNERPGKLDLTEEEKAALVAFLKSLTDSSFVTNPAHSNPF